MKSFKSSRGVQSGPEAGAHLVSPSQKKKEEKKKENLFARMMRRASFATAAWARPSARFSPKSLSESSRANVRRQVGRFDDSLPIASASMPPSSWYIDESFVGAEMEAVFGSTWQLACRADQVQSAGDFVATFIGSEPVVVVRGEDNVLRAFSNVCRHHAARVAEGEGKCSELKCPYHAWTYNLQGRLVRFSKMRGTKMFDAQNIRLPPLRVEEWGPLVFVTSSEAPGTVADILNPMDEVMKPLPASLKFVRRRVYHINANWKVYVDNYLDGGMHIPALHLGLNEELAMQTYKTTLFDHISIQQCATKSDRVGGRDEMATYTFMYPNLALNRYGSWLDTNYVLPVSPTKCVIVFDWYHESADTESARAALEEDLEKSKVIQDEDVYISESVQDGLQSASYDAGRYSPSLEIAEYHFHKMLKQSLTKHLKNKG